MTEKLCFGGVQVCVRLSYVIGDNKSRKPQQFESSGCDTLPIITSLNIFKQFHLK